MPLQNDSRDLAGRPGGNARARGDGVDGRTARHCPRIASFAWLARCGEIGLSVEFQENRTGFSGYGVDQFGRGWAEAARLRKTALGWLGQAGPPWQSSGKPMGRYLPILFPITCQGRAHAFAEDFRERRGKGIMRHASQYRMLVTASKEPHSSWALEIY